MIIFAVIEDVTYWLSLF